MKRTVTQLLCILFVFGFIIPALAENPAGEDPTNETELVDVGNNRAAVIYDIVEWWRETMDAREGVDGWEAELTTALESAPADKLLAATKARTYDEVTAALFGTWQGPDVQTLEPGDAPAAFGSTSTDLVFTPLTPCRIIDTRTATGGYGGVIGPNNGKLFNVNLSNFSAQGGSSGSCGIPTSLEVSAVVLNVTSTGQGGVGWMSVINSGGGIPLSSLVNYTAGTSIANSTVVRSGLAVGPDIYIYSGQSTSHVVVDLMGYFAAPNRTSPDYYREYTYTTISTGLQTAYSDYCESGYEWTSAGAQGFDEGVYVNGLGRNGNLQRSFCTFRNLSGSSQSVNCAAHCLRIPGR